MSPLVALGPLQLASGGFDVGRIFPIIDGFSATMTRAQVETLAGRDDVLSIESNDRVSVLDGSANSSFGVTEARADDPTIDGSHDGSASYSTTDLVAAVVDTGIDSTHVDLDQGKVLAFADCVSDAACPLVAPYDDEGHGTAVASVLAGDGDSSGGIESSAGVAPGAALVVVKTLDANSGGTEGQILSAIQWVVDHKSTYNIRVLNLSFGSDERSNGADAVCRGRERRRRGGHLRHRWLRQRQPVHRHHRLARSGCQRAHGRRHGRHRRRRVLSRLLLGRGPALDGRIKPDISAPGSELITSSANSGTGLKVHSGTSYSAPFAAGVALLMLDANSALTPAEIKTKMRSTAVGWSRGPGDDDLFEAGRLDAYAALRSAGAPISTPPSVPLQFMRSGYINPGAPNRFSIPISGSEPLAVTLNVGTYFVTPGGGPDLDLRLIDPLGNYVGDRENNQIHYPDNDSQEDVSVYPSTFGLYTVEVTTSGSSSEWQTYISAPPSTT